VTLETVDSAFGLAAVPTLPPALSAEDVAAREQVMRYVATLPPAEAAALLASEPGLMGLGGWWSKIRDKAVKIGAVKILAKATAFIPVVGPALAPLASMAAKAAKAKLEGKSQEAAAIQGQITQTANQAAVVTSAAPAAADMYGPGFTPSGTAVPKWAIFAGLGAAALVGVYLLAGRRR